MVAQVYPPEAAAAVHNKIYPIKTVSKSGPISRIFCLRKIAKRFWPLAVVYESLTISYKLFSFRILFKTSKFCPLVLMPLMLF